MDSKLELLTTVTENALLLLLVDPREIWLSASKYELHILSCSEYSTHTFLSLAHLSAAVLSAEIRPASSRIFIPLDDSSFSPKAVHSIDFVNLTN